MQDEMVSAERLEIRLLGPLEVLRGGRKWPLPQSRKTRALLAYLAVTRRQHLRQHLCSLLWEGPADPRAALRWSLTKLRAVTDDAQTKRLRGTQELIGFDTAHVDIDLWHLRHQLGKDHQQAPLPALDAAASIFRGDLLEGLDLPDCPSYDAWLKAEREAVEHLRDSILATLADRSRGAPETALTYARQRTVIKPTNEAAHAQIMGILQAMGRLQEVRAQYEACRRILAREAGVRPSQEMEALRRRLAPGRPYPEAPSAPPVSAAPASLPPLVGRHQERAILDGLVTNARAGKSDVLIVSGEAGVGKTRLLAELRARVEARKGRVLTGRSFEMETGQPYRPWIDVLRGMAVDEVPRHLHGDLAPILPELGPPSSETVDRNRMFEAVLSLFRSQTQHALIAIVLDDLHWFDEASVALLHFIARHGHGEHLLLAGAARTAELEDNAATSRLVYSLSRERRVRHLELQPLSAGQTGRLVHDLDRRLDARQIFRDSGGNPLFAIELAHAADRTPGTRPDRLPELISDRLARLSPRARYVAAWAAACGHEFDLHLLARATNLPTVELMDAMEELERRDIAQAVGPDGYDFRHDLIRRAAYESVSEPRRKLIHGSLARAFSTAGAGTFRAGEAAHHAALCGDFELAARACLEAGRHALKVFAFEQVVELVRRGSGYLGHLPVELALPLQLDLMELWVNPTMKPYHPNPRDRRADAGGGGDLGAPPIDLPHIEDQLWQLIETARRAGLAAEVRKGFHLLGKMHYLRADAPRALATTLDAEKAGRASDEATVLKSIADAARCLAMLDRDMQRAERLSHEAMLLSEKIGEPSFETRLAMGLIQHHAGALDAAVADYEAASLLAWRDPDPWWEFFCLSRLPMVELERGRPNAAVERCCRVEPLARNMSEGGEAAVISALKALSQRGSGDHAATVALDDAVTRLRAVDSKWTLPYVQILAAEQDLAAKDRDRAHERLAEALKAADAVGRRSEVALARSLLAQLAWEAGEEAEAKRQLATVQADLLRPGVLSARAVSTARRIFAMTGAISTPAPTPVPTSVR